MWRLYVAAVDRRIGHRVAQCARELAVPCSLFDGELSELPRHAGAIYCLGSLAAARLREVPEPALIITAGAAVPDDLIAVVTGKRVAAMRLAHLNGATLLHTLMRLTARVDLDGLLQHLAGYFSRLPHQFLTAFVLTPTQIGTLDDIAHAVDGRLPDARRIVAAAGCRQPEHLLAALRSESYSWLSGQGFARSAIEEYLGIKDRPTFRRRCHRAGVPVPWRRVFCHGSGAHLGKHPRRGLRGGRLGGRKGRRRGPGAGAGRTDGTGPRAGS